MSQNTNITQLDSGQIVKRIYDQANDAVRVEIGQGTSFGLSLTADSGDSVTAVPNVVEVKASITNANTGVVIPATSCIGMKSFQLYSNTTSTVVGPQALTLEVSPSDSDNVWKATTLTITPSTTSGTVIMGTVNSAIVARRFRVSAAAAITSGTLDVYALAQST